MPASLLNLEGPSLAACSPCLLTHLLLLLHMGAKISIKKKKKENLIIHHSVA